MTEFTQVATIPKTAQRCKAEGIGLSENQLRTLCARGGAETHPNGEKVPDLLAQPLRAAGAGHAPGGSAGGVWENQEDCGMRGCAPGIPVRGRTGQAAFLPAAEAGRSQRNQRRGRALMVRTGAAKAAGPWPDWTSRLSACGRGGKVTAKPAARACAGGLMSTSEASCPRRESSRAATRRELSRRGHPVGGRR